MIAEHDDVKTEFEFHELSDASKARAVDRCFESVWGDWHSHIIEEWEDKLKEHGFTDAVIRFSGFNSQGDGASFTADFEYVGDAALKWLEPEDADTFTALKVALKMDGHDSNPELEIIGKITQSGHYCHENTMGVSGDVYPVSDGPQDPIVEFIDSLSYNPLDAVLHKAKDLAQDIYSALNAEYDYQTSEENVAELSQANGWRYDENGDLI